MNLPAQFLQRMQAMLGSEYDEFVESFHREGRSGLRVNLLKTSVEELQKAGEFSLSPIPWCDSGFYYDAQEEKSRGLRPGKHPLHEAGAYYIQEPSAMAAAEAVRPFIEESKRPLRVLDLCAAPGGKSSQLAAMMKGRGFLLSNEIHRGRARILSQNMERMGLSGGMVTSMSPQELSRRFPRSFDVILVDAPCSGEGMFRKNEETISQWSGEAVKMCAQRQKDILIEAEAMLAEGGTLVYSTCTFSPEENEDVILWMMKRGWKVASIQRSGGISPGNPLWTEEAEGSLTEEEKRQLSLTARLWPHRLLGEGHFVARLVFTSFCEKQEKEKRQALWRGDKGGLKNKKKQRKRASGSSGLEGFLIRPPREWEEFSTVFFGDGEKAIHRICGEKARWLMLGEQLYATSEDCPSLEGLFVLRPGLHLGTVKKGRFVPSHALAMALSPRLIKELGLTKRCLELWDSKTEEKNRLAEDYLKGAELKAEALPLPPKEKGWYLALYRGFCLGWVRASDGAVKNHYPKGLRWV